MGGLRQRGMYAWDAKESKSGGRLPCPKAASKCARSSSMLCPTCARLPAAAGHTLPLGEIAGGRTAFAAI